MADRINAQPPPGALIDVCLDAGGFGFELASDLRASFSDVPVVLMSGHSAEWLDDPSASAPRIAKPIGPEALDMFLRASVTQCVLDRSPLAEIVLKVAEAGRLTVQETTVLVHLAAGVERAALSDALGRSENTVKSQIRQLLTKLSAASVDEVVRMLLRRLRSACFSSAESDERAD